MPSRNTRKTAATATMSHGLQSTADKRSPMLVIWSLIGINSASAPAAALLSGAVRILVTGGCGFIGSNFIRYILEHYKQTYVTNVDVLTYAGNPANLEGVVEEFGERYEFYKADIANPDQMDPVMTEHA